MVTTIIYPGVHITYFSLLLYKVKLKSNLNQVGVEPIDQSSFQDETSYGECMLVEIHLTFQLQEQKVILKRK